MLHHQSELQNKLKPLDRRLAKLDEHLEQVDIRRKYKPIMAEYKALPPKKQKAFLEEHEPKLQQYKAADKYLKAHLNGRDKIPARAWADERERLIAEKKELNRGYLSMTDRLKQIDRIRKAARELLGHESRQQSRNRRWELER